MFITYIFKGGCKRSLQIAIAIRFAVHEASGPKRISFDGEGRDVVDTLAELPDLWDVNISGWSRDSGTSRYDQEGFQEQFTSFVIDGSSISQHSLMRKVGKGSNRQDFVGEFLMILSTVS